MRRTGGSLFKAINSILLVANRLGGRVNFHKLFKILYFAEQKHCVRYGSDIMGDHYVPMAYGPVPSMVYNIVKTVKAGRAEWLIDLDPKVLSKYMHVEDHWVTASRPVDADHLSESEIECLEEAVRENKDLSFAALTMKSHDAAWEEATNKDLLEMDWLTIARAGNATKEMLEYLSSVRENRTIFKQ